MSVGAEDSVGGFGSEDELDSVEESVGEEVVESVPEEVLSPWESEEVFSPPEDVVVSDDVESGFYEPL